MNPLLGKLSEIARKDSRVVLGLMSGTSLDGLDLALCRIKGFGQDTSLSLEQFTTVPYEESFRQEVRKVFSRRDVDLQLLCVLNPFIGRLHADIILSTLKSWQVSPDEVDLIASHGQTVFHAPRTLHQLAGYPDATLQIGDGDHIAVSTGIITVSDFRQKHIAAGGEGAPLAVYGDFLLFSTSEENRILLNLGGIANFTFLPKAGSNRAVFTTDTGPGNTLMDAYCQTHFNCEFDPDGRLAAGGTVYQPLLRSLLDSPFLKQSFPKSTGPEIFNLRWLANCLEESRSQHLSHEDVMATLALLTARSVANSISGYLPKGEKTTIYASGGGANNPFVLDLIQQHLKGIPIKHTAELGIPGDAKEAVLFAVLANETVAAPSPALPGNTGSLAVSLGKISFPG